jgi:hypothetical protein
MEPVPSGPDRGEIVEAADAAGVTFSWPAYKAGSAGYWVVGFLVCWLFLCALFCFSSARDIARGPATTALYASLVGWAFVGIVGVAALWWQVRPHRPESVRLEADVFRYYPGRGPSDARSCAELPSGKVVPVKPAPAFELPKSAVRGFGVDRVNGRQRLYVDTDDTRTEIGGCLTEAERAWLFAALRAWLGAAQPKPWQRQKVRS